VRFAVGQWGITFGLVIEVNDEDSYTTKILLMGGSVFSITLEILELNHTSVCT
jgi:hypothetical protein